MKGRLFLVLRTALLSLITFTSLGCTAVVTVSLEPVLVAQDCTSDHDAASLACGFPCGLATHGTGCQGSKEAVPANSLKSFTYPVVPPAVGWGDFYDDGTDPCPCWEWVSTFSRGYARFDLTKLVGPVESVKFAAVSWKTKRLEGGSPKACIQSLYAATGPWKRGATPADLLFDKLDTTAVSGGYYGITQQAVHWWESPNENYGLMFVPSRAQTVKESNSDCLDALENLRLTVKYRQKKTDWPSH